jgi:hypothetical protein
MVESSGNNFPRLQCPIAEFSGDQHILLSKQAYEIPSSVIKEDLNSR